MLVWRGFGFFVVLIAAACVFGGQAVTNQFFGEGYWTANAWPAAAALFVAGAVSWLLGRRLNKPARKNANPRRPWTHDLLFVRMEWWAFPLAALAVAAVVLNFSPGSAVRTVKAAGQETTQKLAPAR